MADMAEDDHAVATCRWGTLTLSLRYPRWFAAENCPWTCLRDIEPRPLETTVECRTCSGWTPKSNAGPPYPRLV